MKKCPSHTLEYKRRYNLKNKERIAKVTHEYYLNNKERLSQINIERKLSNPEKYIITRTKQNAKKRGIEFAIDETDIIIPEYCPILGIKLEMNLGKGFSLKYSAPSIDRIDSSKGYVKGNVWIISNKANIMKNDATIEELISFSKGILRIFGTRQ